MALHGDKALHVSFIFWGGRPADPMGSEGEVSPALLVAQLEGLSEEDRVAAAARWTVEVLGRPETIEIHGSNPFRSLAEVDRHMPRGALSIVTETCAVVSRESVALVLGAWSCEHHLLVRHLDAGRAQDLLADYVEKGSRPFVETSGVGILGMAPIAVFFESTNPGIEVVCHRADLDRVVAHLISDV